MASRGPASAYSAQRTALCRIRSGRSNLCIVHFFVSSSFEISRFHRILFPPLLFHHVSRRGTPTTALSESSCHAKPARLDSRRPTPSSGHTTRNPRTTRTRRHLRTAQSPSLTAGISSKPILSDARGGAYGSPEGALAAEWPRRRPLLRGLLVLPLPEPSRRPPAASQQHRLLRHRTSTRTNVKPASTAPAHRIRTGTWQ